MRATTIKVGRMTDINLNDVRNKIFSLNYSGEYLRIEFEESGVYFQINFSIDGNISFTSNCRNYQFISDRNYYDSLRWDLITVNNFIRKWGVNFRKSLYK